MLGQCERARVSAGAQRGRQRQGICVETMPKEFYPYTVVLATLERVSGAVSTRRKKVYQCTAPMRPHAHGGRATLGPRRHPFGSASSISRVGYARPRRRAPSAGISTVHRRHSGAAEQRRCSRGEVTVRPAIVDQHREDGTGRHEAALAGCSHHGLAGTALAVGISRSRGGDWGNRS
jgi:hypothetical protein